MRHVHEPGEIVRFMYSPFNFDGDEFPVEAMVLKTTMRKDGVIVYDLSIPDVPDSEIPDGEPHPIHGRTEKYRMTGGCVPGIRDGDLLGQGHAVRHAYDRDRRDRKMEEAGNLRYSW